MTKKIVTTMAVLVTGAGLAEDSAPFLLDTVTISTLPIVDSLEIPWDVSWIGGDVGATVVITDNGVEARHVTGTGEFTLSGIGRHDLTYVTYIDGVVQDEVYSATVYTKWKYEVEDGGGVVVVETTQTAGAVTIPSEIDGHPITALGANVFGNCTNLTSVTIPPSVTNIGSGAFCNCSGLTSVTMPDSVTSIGDNAFYCCTNLMNVAIPDNMTSIGDYAFFSCMSLTSIEIPNTVTNIGTFAFRDCGNLTNICVVAGNEKYQSENGILLSKDDRTLIRGVNGAITIPDGVTVIEDYAFSRCNGLTHVTVPNSVTNIGSHAFYECSELAGVTIPDNVRSIGGYAFYNCKNLAGAIMIPDGMTRLDDSTFYNCSNLTSVVIGNSVTNIGKSAFRNCTKLESVMIPDTMKRIGIAAFSGCVGLKAVYITDIAAWCSISFGLTSANPLYYAHNLYINGLPIGDLTIPNNVTNISNYAFCNCTNLTSVMIGSYITRIGSSAFYGCSGLTAVYITDLDAWCGISFSNNSANPLYYAQSLYLDGLPATDLTISDDVTNIGNYAFSSCTNLTNVTIGNGVTNIGTYAFYSCTGLTSVKFYGNAPTSSGSVFSGVTSACCAYARRESTGWGGALPRYWNGIILNYIRHDVTFDANGGICEVASLTVEDGLQIGAMPVPTRENAVFLGWFTEYGMEVDELTTVTSPVTLYAHWLTEVANPVVTTDWGTLVFRTNSCVVSISCTTEGALIYYTNDGTTPKKNDNYLYVGPFTITDTTTIKAVAVIGDVQSEYVTVTITKKLLSLEEALDMEEGVPVATSATLPWRPILNLSAKVGDATARSGAIGDRTNTWLSATVSGAGTMSFWCKVSCEHDDDNTFTWDRLMVYTNDVEVVEWRMDGETDWTRREVSFAGGENTVKWVYFKDRSISEGEDCAWVDGVTWTLADVAVDVGGGKSVLVPMDWVDAHSNIVMAVGGDKSAAMKSTAANGRKVWECYVLGLDPEKTDDFKITSFPMRADGTPDLSAITFEPAKSKWNLSGATPKLKGKTKLDAAWQDVPEGGNPLFRFFTVEVQLP